MSWKTPAVSAEWLHEPGGAADIAVGSASWYAWLADERHCSFHYTHPQGVFTARKERKQRGQWYWVAYRQTHGKLYKAYIGKSETLTEERLQTVAIHLAQQVSSADEDYT